MFRVLHLTTGKYVYSYWVPAFFNSRADFFGRSDDSTKHLFKGFIQTCPEHLMSLSYEDGSNSYSLHFSPDEFELMET